LKRALPRGTLVAVLAFAQPALAASPHLVPPLSGLQFLIGAWAGGQGRVADTGGTSTGSATFTVQANGAVILRRDHTDLLDKAGKQAGSFDQLMVIYPDAGSVHADYFDGRHVIHYVSASVTPGQAVTFSTAPAHGVPDFRLSYHVQGPTLSVDFAVKPPGAPAFQLVAAGTLRRRE
jgi:hypothetical protein